MKKHAQNNKKEIKQIEQKNKITMNLPNKLTLLRIILVPVIVIVYMICADIESVALKPVFSFLPTFSILNCITLVLFGIAAFTDYLDGAIARKQGLVTNFGKFADPLADKLLVYTVFVLMLHQNYINRTALVKDPGDIFEWWMLVVVLAREFIVTGVRYMAAANGTVVAASKLGKAKTIAQYIAVVVVLVFGAATNGMDGIHWAYVVVCKLALFVMLILTVISGADYVIKNKDVFYDKK